MGLTSSLHFTFGVESQWRSCKVFAAISCTVVEMMVSTPKERHVL